MAIQLKKAKADPSSRYVQIEMCFDNFIAGCSKSSHKKNPLFYVVEVLVYAFYKEKIKAYFLFVA